MSVEMVAFEIPENIKAGLVAGIYEQVGGIIRTSGNKQVVTWLKPADIAEYTSEASRVETAWR